MIRKRRYSSRLRWRVAYLVKRLPGQCWADLVSWALYGWSGADDRYPWTTPSRLASCRADAARAGCCYCGRFRHPTTTTAAPAAETGA